VFHPRVRRRLPDLRRVPRLVEALSRGMTRASLRVVSIDYLHASNGLQSGEVDMLIAMKRDAKGLHWAGWPPH